jgi:general L-amino acid transport system permease protein
MQHDPFKTPAEIKAPILFWIKKNLFGSWLNTLLTLLSGWIIYLLIVKSVIPLAALDWTVIRDNLKLILTGSYPADQLWRVWLCLGYVSFFGGITSRLSSSRMPKVLMLILAAEALLLLFGFSPTTKIALAVNIILAGVGFIVASKLKPGKRTVIALLGWIALMPFVFIVIQGFTGPLGVLLPLVKPNYWGGLLLSMIIALTAIMLSFPVGLLLALGRRSPMRFVSFFCTLIIEVIRGVPLITILFIGYLIVPLALPASMSPSVFFRAMIGIILFHAAYMAENFRGGLQGIPRTQYEAAASLNLGTFKTMVFIVLPQVLKRMIPVLVSAFTGILKDTSLISIIGLLDLIGISTAIGSNPSYMTDSTQVLIFMAGIYFILCYSISAASVRIEETLGVTKPTRRRIKRNG